MLRSVVCKKAMAILKLPNYLRTYRTKAGLTLRDSAYLLGISHVELSRYETHLREMPLGVAISCCLLYGFTIQQMFAGVYRLSAEFVACRLMLFRKRLLRRISGGSSSLLLTRKLSWTTERLTNLATLSI
jgi:transcriptional regulator with XRE-family HTH domain